MIKKIRHFKLPTSLYDNSDNDWLINDLYLTEIGEIEVEEGSIWSEKCDNACFLAYCIKGEGIVNLGGEQAPVSGDQFFIIPGGESFKYYSILKSNSRFLISGFIGRSINQIRHEFLVVRNLVPSVTNMVANREMLFEEIFNNLNKGLHPKILAYVNLCFGHLLATFLYANRNSEDLDNELNPSVHRAIQYFEKNLHKKLTLHQIAAEAGYSPTYFTTIFRNHTNYSPLSYFSHLKILKACEFLDYTRMKVKEISYQLGYLDPYYFTREFKNKMGLSPRQYRNRIRTKQAISMKPL